MDDSLFYDVRSDGYFCVHFANKRALSVNEIKEFFSQFGEVMYVNCAGDEHGFRFVTMRNEEDVKQCIAALRNHEFIKVLPKRHKVQETNGARKQDGNIKQSRKNPKNGQFNSQNQKQNEDLNVSYVDDGSWETNSVTSSRPLETNSIQNVLSEFSKIRKSCGTQNALRHERVENKLVGDDRDRMPELISIDGSVPPNLHTSINGTFSRPKTIPAHEVIVANIHLNLGVHYILHLFEKYDPICVTLMKTISPYNIRYCRVYFKTSQEALATEREFDRLVLCGMNLIVLRPQRLIEEWNS